MIISTGIASYEDIELAVKTCREAGNNDITILKCTSSYPAPIHEANLVMMQRFAKDFNVKVGLSDHTLGNTVPVVATALGATVIEKHFILDKSVGGPDASFSLDEKEFTDMVNAVRNAEKAMGKESYELTEKQIAGKAFARSLYVAEDIKKGELITDKNVRSVRPGFGLHPKFLTEILGKVAKQDLEKGERFKIEFINK
jgi:pseudaminic acid synthase